MPRIPFWSPGFGTLTVSPAPGAVMVHVTMTDGLPAPVASVTEKTTVWEPAVVGVPLMTPVAGLIVRPSGRPLAANVSVVSGFVSAAWSWKDNGAPAVPADRW